MRVRVGVGAEGGVRVRVRTRGRVRNGVRVGERVGVRIRFFTSDSDEPEVLRVVTIRWCHDLNTISRGHSPESSQPG